MLMLASDVDEEKTMMRTTRLLCATVAVALMGLGAASAQTYKMTTPIAPGVATPDKVDSSIGTLNLKDGYPAAETIQKIYDNLDRSRALQAYLLGFPIVNQVGMRRSLREFGPDNQTNVIWENLVDSKTVELTANDNTVYSFIWLDTSKGPLVFEIPPKVLGLIDDMWYNGLPMLGSPRGPWCGWQISHPSARLQGRHPGGLSRCASEHLRHWMPFRSFLVDGSPKPGVDLVKKTLKIYNLATRPTRRL